MNRSSIVKQWMGAGSVFAGAALLTLGACAPLPQNGTDAAVAPAASAAVAAQPASAVPAKTVKSPLVQGEQRIVVGSASGFHKSLKVTAPSQVCDQDAFADGVRYGYALTWNRLIAESAAGKNAKRRFDAATLHSQDDEYKIQWEGKERTNACASDGYLIGRVVGTHLAGVDLRDGKPSS